MLPFNKKFRHPIIERYNKYQFKFSSIMCADITLNIEEIKW
jgi:hypothetical protein